MNEIGTSVREREIYKVTLVGSLVNILLVVCKFAAGFGGKSAAMIADAVHSLSDLITDLIVIVFVRISSKPEDKGHDYGHGKYETLATFLIGAALLAVGVGICWSGIESIISLQRRGITVAWLDCTGCCHCIRGIERNFVSLHPAGGENAVIVRQ